MIELRKMENQNFRIFGWVQDPSDFESLIKVVSIFDNKSETYKELTNGKIAELIEERDGKSHFLKVLNTIPLRIKYADLVGTSFIPRSSARCNGIVQATVKGQVRSFISDWPADNFVRWAQALGFIKYNYFDDFFEITEEGLKLTRAKLSEEKEEILEDALLSYPPAVRILKLLSDGNVKTKFEFDSQQNRLFEMKTVELLTKECNYKGIHLGSSRKPDGIIYTENSTDNYGVIIDTKAYSNGYNLPISQVDEMIRYVEENNKREKERNSNEWWKEFGDDINKFYFSFISGKFIGNIEEKLQRITLFTNVYGNAMTIITLLYLANEIKANRLKNMEVVKYFDNKVY